MFSIIYFFNEHKGYVAGSDWRLFLNSDCTLTSQFIPFIVALLKVMATLPRFYTASRMKAIRRLFHMLDYQGTSTLDDHELAPFLYYAFLRLFREEVAPGDIERLFHIIDLDIGGFVSVNEFVVLVGLLKQLEQQCRQSPQHERPFPNFERAESFVGSERSPAERQVLRQALWVHAVRLREESFLKEAIDALLRVFGSSDEGAIAAALSPYDADGNSSYNAEEVGDSKVSSLSGKEIIQEKWRTQSRFCFIIDRSTETKT